MNPIRDLNIDSTWTLFLDRDGVINVEKNQDYIRHKGEFVFTEGTLEAMAGFAKLFPRIFVVTNQKGIGKGLMTHDDIADIHQHMVEQVVAAGGRIDRIYYCAELDDDHSHRKPNPGMGLQAAQDYPATDFNRSLMVGNTMSDMAFGKNLGMITVFIPSTKPMPELPHPLVDHVTDNLLSLAKAL
jgi:D-glycero-D-manno-heptose 1,7-bisphosphate phosphatase